MSIWVTRSAPDNLATARRLRAAGLRPLLLPLVETRPLESAPLAAQPEALVFSSIHAVRHHAPQPRLRNIPVFVRSAEIANAARQAGYTSITSTFEDEAMLVGLLDHLVGDGGSIAYFCGARTSPTLQHAFGRDRRVERRDVYTSDTVDPRGLEPLMDRLARVGSIVLHSSLGSETVRAMIEATNWHGPVWCISHRSAEALAPVRGIRSSVARCPSESALVDLVVAGTGRRLSAPVHRPVDVRRPVGQARGGLPVPFNDN